MPLAEHDDELVLLGGGEVFRLPLAPSGLARLTVLVRALPVLRSRVPVAVAPPRWVGVLPDGETPFTAEPRLPGRPPTGPLGSIAAGQLAGVGAALGNVVAGLFIILFASYFFLADGDRIWAWLVRLAPRAARQAIDGSGRVAWISLTQFVRATVIVALVDAVGIVIVAAALGVPFVLAIGVLVFLGAFVPLVGATVAGTVAVLVALVDQGPFTALLMLGGVILVQQIEGQVLQPFLMGRFVSMHPLGVVVAIGCGVLVAGIAGALIAVPLAAAVNAVAQHLSERSPTSRTPARRSPARRW